MEEQLDQGLQGTLAASDPVAKTANILTGKIRLYRRPR
jgi:hypothetical protein